MASEIHLEASTIEWLDDVVLIGGFSSRDEVIRAGLRLLKERDEADHEPLTPSEIAGIERGLAAAAAGDVHDVDEVFDELRRRNREGR